jgi:hypothetical protein
MRKLAKDEIDLSKIIIILFSNKLKIFLITLITVIIGFSLILSQPASKTFLIKAQIRPVTIFEISKYQEYNTYLSNKYQNEIEMARNILLKSKIEGEDYKYYKTDFFHKIVNQNVQKNNLDKIDSMYLYSLFIATMNEEERLIQLIKKFNIIKKEKYQDNQLYEDEIKKLMSSIKVTDYEFLKKENMSNPSLNFSNIQLKAESKEVGVELLNLIMENVNNDIKNHLKREFDNLVISSNKQRTHKVEDIEFEISNNLEDKNIVNQLTKLKKRIERNKDIERLITIFERTPIFSDEFYAGKFRIRSYEDLNELKNSFKLNFFKFVLLGLLLGIIYVMVENTIKKLEKKLKSH